MMKDAHRFVIASPYMDGFDFLGELLKQANTCAEITIVTDRLDEQSATKAISLIDTQRCSIFLVNGMLSQEPLFHVKLVAIKTKTGWTTWLGSANVSRGGSQQS
jgi:hypothetical protein